MGFRYDGVDVDADADAPGSRLQVTMRCAALRCVSFRSGVMRVNPPYKKQIQIKYVRQTPGVGIKQQISTGASEFRIRKEQKQKRRIRHKALSCMYIVVCSRGN